MSKLIGIALIIGLFFVGSASAQTDEVETEYEYDEDKAIQLCESEADKLNLEGDSREAHIDECIYTNSETTEELEESQESTSTLDG